MKSPQKIILLLISLIPTKFLHSTLDSKNVPASEIKATQEMKKRVEKSSAIGLFQVLEGAKVVAFSKDNLIRVGLEDKDLKGWHDLIQAANDFVLKSITENNAHAEYKNYIETMQKMYAFVLNAVKKLHNQYARAYAKPQGKENYSIDVSAIAVDKESLEYLKKVIEDAKYYATHARAFNDNTLRYMTQDAPAPENWTKQLLKDKKIKDADQIFKGYKKFLDSYKTIGLTDFNQFMQKNRITNKKDAEKMIDLLEKIKFIMQEKVKTDIKPQERQENTRLISEILAKIHERFPDILSPLTMDTLGATQDKSSMILFAQSGAYESVLNQLAREAQALSKALNAKL